MQTSEVDPFAFSTPGSCHLQERTRLDSGVRKSHVCLVTSMLDAYGHLTPRTMVEAFPLFL